MKEKGFSVLELMTTIGFPDQESFLSMIKQAGFENASYRNLSLGIAALHSGWKI